MGFVILRTEFLDPHKGRVLVHHLLIGQVDRAKYETLAEHIRVAQVG